MSVTQVSAMPAYRIVTARPNEGVSVAANTFQSVNLAMPVPTGWAIASVWARTYSQYLLLLGLDVNGSTVQVQARNVGTGTVTSYRPQAWALLVPEAQLAT